MLLGNLKGMPIFIKNKNMTRIALLLTVLLISGCTMTKEKVDMLVRDARIYSVDSSFSMPEAMAIKEGRIYDIGSNDEITSKYSSSNTVSMKGKYIYPGWYDAHCHFVGYGLSLNEVELTGTKSVEEILERCREFAQQHPGTWITGRGWDQNDWTEKAFPGKEILDREFPERPVYLKRIDGHAAWINSRAMEIAAIDKNTTVEGGELLLHNGKASGILIDNAMDLVGKHIPPPDEEAYVTGILQAQKNCFAVGLTSVSDAGLSTREVQIIDSLQKAGQLNMRINAWLSPSESNFKNYIEKGVVQNDHLTIGTLKLYADGALGSRGAKMIEDYSDDPGNKGLLVSEISVLKDYCMRALKNNYQVAIHCIGDDANRQVLKLYGELLEEDNDRRWRIEHAQIIHPDDFPLFQKYKVVPSVQSTHATSDMYWAADRIGAERMAGAYSYKTLLKQLGWIPNGSDFPVEDINPLYGFYSFVARKDHEGYPEDGFRMEEALSREEALRAMTLWAAKAAFEDTFKGSLEKGKLADFVVTDQDIMTVDLHEIPGIKVHSTYSGGIKVYER